MRWLKLIGAAVATLVTAAGLLLGALYVVDLSVLKPEVEQLVSRIAGRELVIAGTFRPTFGRHTNLIVEDVRFANAPWAQGDMARLDRGEITVDLFSLLRGPVQVTHLLVKGAEIHLERNADGVANWQLSEPGEIDERLPEVLLHHSDVEDLSVSYDAPDRAAPLTVDISHFSQRLGDDNLLQLSGAGVMGRRAFSINGDLSALPVVLSGSQHRARAAYSDGWSGASFQRSH